MTKNADAQSSLPTTYITTYIESISKKKLTRVVGLFSSLEKLGAEGSLYCSTELEKIL